MANKEGVIPEIVMSRRDFLKLGGIALAAGGLLGYGAYELDRTPDVSKEEPCEDVLNKIQSKYGIYIPRSEGEYVQYGSYQTEGGKTERYGGVPNTQVNLEEAKIIEESLAIVPSAGKLVQLIIPFRDSAPGVFPGGYFWGRDWDYQFDRSKYPEYPTDRYISELSAIQLILTDKNMDEPLPVITPDSNCLPAFSLFAMSMAGIKPVNAVNFPWTTHGERLRQTVIHEVGHGISVLANRMKVNFDPLIESRASYMSLFGGANMDTYNPIYSSFAQINGWKMIPYAEFVSQWGEYGKAQAEYLEANIPHDAHWPIWDRDPAVWGPLENRRVRLDTYSSYGSISETFASFFMFYLLGKHDSRYDLSLLTKQERSYFREMDWGLTLSTEGYLRALIKNYPGPTYYTDKPSALFLGKSKSSRS
jgi:hypothetical protein